MSPPPILLPTRSRSCCIRWRLGYQYLTNTTIGVFQYVAIRLACTAITLITEYCGVYKDVSGGFQGEEVGGACGWRACN
jgi:hypothetical protein